MKKKEKKEEIKVPRTKIKVVGIGGGGNSIAAEISKDKRFRGIDFIALNTDVQALKKMPRTCRVLKLGQETTSGLGCGMDPQLGEKAARQGLDKIKKAAGSADFCIIIACLGGGMGSGGAPVVAEACRVLKKCCMGIFTLPFSFEGSRKRAVAKNSLKKVKSQLNALTAVQNEKIFRSIDKSTPLKEAFSSVNQDLAFKLAGLMEMIYKPGLINIDWADFKTILEGKGKLCYLNRAEGAGEDRALAAAKKVVQSNLNEYSLRKAERILFNIEGGKGLKMSEVESISSYISGFNKKARIIFGISQPGSKSGQLRITLLATETDKEKKPVLKKEPLKEEKKPLPKKKPRKKARPKKKKEAVRTARRKNALALKKEEEKEEKEILEEEKKWELPAFLRKNE